MTDPADLAAFRTSVAKLTGGPRDVPADRPSPWVADHPGMVDLGLLDLLEVADGAVDPPVDVCVAAVQEFAVALHAAPLHALLPVAAARGAEVADLSVGQGAPVVALALLDGAPDGDTGPQLSGVTRPLAALEGITHLLVPVTGPTNHLALVDLGGTGVQRRPEPALDVVRPLTEVRFTDAEVTWVDGFDDVPWMVAVSHLLLLADSWAVTSRAVERTVAYAAERLTFGAPIGQYQAVQHRLVEHAVTVRQASALLDTATAALTATWTAGAQYPLAAAEVFLLERAQTIVSDCIQLTGAIGFTWEYGLHFALRRVIENARLTGGARRARADLIRSQGW